MDEGAKIIELPLVLAIDCTKSFVDRCRSLGQQARSKFLVRACDLAAAARMAPRASIIVVPRRLYEQKAAEIDRLAAKGDAALLTC